MNDLITIICNRHESLKKKIQKLKDYLTDDRKIVIEKELFSAAIVDVISKKGDFINEQAVQIYLILHHCIKHYSARSKKGEILSFQNAMNILYEAVHDYITLEGFYKLINFQDHDGNTLLHRAVISNNTDAIEVLFQKNANPLLKNKGNKIPLDLAQENTRKVLIKCMQDQAQSKKEIARCNSLIGIIPGVFLGIGLGVGGALVPSMTIILCALAVSALVAGIAVGLSIYFLSQDYKQAKLIEGVVAIDSQLHSVKPEKTADNKAVLG
ncbi:hypothetical protein [Wolbachia endosymbiont (group B) of Ablattaria laevigata]|uniref:hypothetical protein n=1 Tax=Wolbachia endosymbiont (group B) of Ablattaria laevigata TaxID=3077915 RepID=UPI00376EBEE1